MCVDIESVHTKYRYNSRQRGWGGLTETGMCSASRERKKICGEHEVYRQGEKGAWEHVGVGVERSAVCYTPPPRNRCRRNGQAEHISPVSVGIDM